VSDFMSLNLLSNKQICERFIKAKHQKSILCVISFSKKEGELTELEKLGVISKKDSNRYPFLDRAFAEFFDIDIAIKFCDSLNSPCEVWFNGVVFHTNEKGEV